MTRLQIATLVIVGACYVGLTALRAWRVPLVWAGAFLLVAVGAISPLEGLRAVDLNVLGMLVGTAVLARLFADSGVPLLLAKQIATYALNARMAILSVCFAAGFLSSWVDNVATVLIAAPVALAIADHLEADPAPFVIALTLSANLRGAATLIGDATSMILASYSGMAFNSFFWFHGRPSLFFIVQAAAMAGVLVLQRVFRSYRRRKPAPFPQVVVKTWVPSVLLVVTVATLAATHFLHLRVPHLSAAVCLGAAALGAAHFTIPRWRREGALSARRHAALALRAFDWGTVLLIAGLFVVVGALSTSGLTALLALEIEQVVGSSFVTAFVVVVAASVLLSGIVDNIPFVTALVPVVSALGLSLGTGPRDRFVMLFGLLIGGTVGGNMVPIGASTSIVAVGLLEKRGRRVSLSEFMRIGVPYTVVATLAAAAFIWVFWRLIP